MLEFQHVLEKGAAYIKMKVKYFYDFLPLKVSGPYVVASVEDAV